MCGIVGLYDRNGRPTDADVLRRMTHVLRHRGPDDRGMALFSLRARSAVPLPFDGSRSESAFEGGLGFNRLSILDLTEQGHQPMFNADGTIAIVFNGEIYNAFELRPALEAAGIRFKSRTDTEVLLYLYQTHGLRGALERLNGMFAFCILDLNRQALLLARDHLGVKPLYWYERDGAFLFSSEVKAFLEHPAFRAEIDEGRVDEYLAFRYCAGEGFLLKGVHQLAPATFLEVTAVGSRVERYWEIPDGVPQDTMDFPRAVSTLEEHLHRSVRMQLLSDVKVGCQLSGGIDSSLVNVLAVRHAGADMDAFSIVFDDQRLSEEPWIDEAARVAGVRSHRFRLNAETIVDSIDSATWHLDEPLTHPNSVGISHLARNARSTVTVLLSGEGADELFGGYNRFLYAALRPVANRLRWAFRWLPVAGKRLAARFGNHGLDEVDWFLAQSSFDGVGQLRPDGRFDHARSARRSLFEHGKGDYLRNCFKYELQTYLVNLLVRQDKMTMAHSMENRVPFLDHEMVAFVCNLPTRFLVSSQPRLDDMRVRNTKRVLKELALKYFRPGFVFRPKMGFAMPLREVFRHPRFVRVMEDELLPGMRARGLVRADLVDRWWRGGVSEEVGREDLLWACVALEVWARLYLDRTHASQEHPTPQLLSAS